MKRKNILIVTAVLAALVFGLAAQGMAFPGAGGGHWKEHGHRHMQADRLELMAIVLDLSQAQKTQIKEIVSAERTAMKPWFKQLWEGRRELRQATAHGTFDQAKVKAAAAKMAQAKTELIVSKAQVRSKIFAVFTPKQKALAEKIEPLLHHQRMGRHGRF